MNRFRILQTLPLLAALVLLAAGCTQNELGNEQGEPLPEGMYPIEFTATGLQATPQTRTTADGRWNGDEKIAIKAYGEVKPYTAPSSDNAALTPTDNNKFYWQSTKDTTVLAWYPYTDAIPETWEVQRDQNKDNGTEFQKSDFLYAQDKFKFGENNVLNFHHQTAKVVINIRNKGVLTDANKINETKIINVCLQGKFSGSKYELSADQSGSKEAIKPKQASPNTGVYFDGDGSYGETALVSYEALVIPQTINAGVKLFVIDIKGYSLFYYTVPAGGIEWKAGTEHTYNITIEGSKLSVTTSESIGWGTDGASGSGSVTFI